MKPKKQLMMKMDKKVMPMGKGMMNPVCKTGGMTGKKMGIKAGKKGY